ncbi:radical SAM protein [Pseudotabrizicola sp.]|uniref:radical SAM protein n=1 Tax=Pseudotabrizicola sp. TaxID=2939647 RepID=UPI0027265ED1|nr:radical SAM protein [Pseudotabrizicola sp.]MDO8881799.1 radical SAM protein [Pseudotabrizicola sp.]
MSWSAGIDSPAASVAAKPARMIALNHADPRHARVVLIDWMLGNHCNFACDYCPTELHDGSLPWMPVDVATGFLDTLHDHYVAGLGRSLWLQLTGGEPTQYPGFFDLCSAAHARGIKVAVISNGSRTARFWHRATPVLASAILTYHDLQVDHSQFLETLGILTGAGVPVHVNVTVHPDRFDAILERVDDIRAAGPGASLTLKPLRLGFGQELYPYTEAQKDHLSKRQARLRSGQSVESEALLFQRGLMARHLADGTTDTWRANDLLLAGENRWQGMRCHAGLESLRIKADGRVFRAVCGSGGCLGQLGQGTIDLPVLPLTCDRHSCACVADILITKTATQRNAAP